MKICVKVKPNSKKGPLVVKTRDDLGEIFEVFVREAAVGGRANLAVSKILAEHFGVSKSRISLEKGAKSRIKTFKIEI